jgi:hypothetical protein
MLLVIGVLGGCTSETTPKGYVRPTHLVGQIAPADRIVVKSLFASFQQPPKFASFSMTITGGEVQRIIHEISTLREPDYGGPGVASDCLYDWQLQFYQRTELLGVADLADCLIRCDGVEYHMSGTLKRFYQRIEKESGKEN